MGRMNEFGRDNRKEMSEAAETSCTKAWRLLKLPMATRLGQLTFGCLGSFHDAPATGSECPCMGSALRETVDGTRGGKPAAVGGRQGKEP